MFVMSKQDTHTQKTNPALVQIFRFSVQQPTCVCSKNVPGGDILNHKARAPVFVEPVVGVHCAWKHACACMKQLMKHPLCSKCSRIKRQQLESCFMCAILNMQNMSIPRSACMPLLVLLKCPSCSQSLPPLSFCSGSRHDIMVFLKV